MHDYSGTTRSRARALYRARKVGPEATYFDAAAFRRWANRRLGTHASASRIARILGLRRSTVSAYMRGERSPSLETYFRIVEAAGVDVLAFVRHLEPLPDCYKIGGDSPETASDSLA